MLRRLTFTQRESVKFQMASRRRRCRRRWRGDSVFHHLEEEFEHVCFADTCFPNYELSRATRVLRPHEGVCAHALCVLRVR